MAYSDIALLRWSNPTWATQRKIYIDEFEGKSNAAQKRIDTARQTQEETKSRLVTLRGQIAPQDQTGMYTAEEYAKTTEAELAAAQSALNEALRQIDASQVEKDEFKQASDLIKGKTSADTDYERLTAQTWENKDAAIAAYVNKHGTKEYEKASQRANDLRASKGLAPLTDGQDIRTPAARATATAKEWESVSVLYKKVADVKYKMNVNSPYTTEQPESGRLFADELLRDKTTYAAAMKLIGASDAYDFYQKGLAAFKNDGKITELFEGLTEEESATVEAAFAKVYSDVTSKGAFLKIDRVYHNAEYMQLLKDSYKADADLVAAKAAKQKLDEQGADAYASNKVFKRRTGLDRDDPFAALVIAPDGSEVRGGRALYDAALFATKNILTTEKDGTYTLADAKTPMETAIDQYVTKYGADVDDKDQFVNYLLTKGFTPSKVTTDGLRRYMAHSTIEQFGGKAPRTSKTLSYEKKKAAELVERLTIQSRALSLAVNVFRRAGATVRDVFKTFDAYRIPSRFIPKKLRDLRKRNPDLPLSLTNAFPVPIDMTTVTGRRLAAEAAMNSDSPAAMNVVSSKLGQIYSPRKTDRIMRAAARRTGREDLYLEANPSRSRLDTVESVPAPDESVVAPVEIPSSVDMPVSTTPEVMPAMPMDEEVDQPRIAPVTIPTVEVTPPMAPMPSTEELDLDSTMSPPEDVDARMRQEDLDTVLNKAPMGATEAAAEPKLKPLPKMVTKPKSKPVAKTTTPVESKAKAQTPTAPAAAPKNAGMSSEEYSKQLQALRAKVEATDPEDEADYQKALDAVENFRLANKPK